MKSGVSVIEEFLSSGEGAVRLAGIVSAARLDAEQLTARLVDRVLLEEHDGIRRHIQQHILELDTEGRSAAAASLVLALESPELLRRQRAYEMLGLVGMTGATPRLPRLSLAQRLGLVTWGLPRLTGGTSLERLQAGLWAYAGILVGTVLAAIPFLVLSSSRPSSDIAAYVLGMFLLLPFLGILTISYTRPSGLHTFRILSAGVESVRCLPDFVVFTLGVVFLFSADNRAGMMSILCVALIVVILSVTTRFATALSYDASLRRWSNFVWQALVGTSAGVLAMTLLAIPGAVHLTDPSGAAFEFARFWPFALAFSAGLALPGVAIDARVVTMLPASAHGRRMFPRPIGLVVGGALAAVMVVVLGVGTARARSTDPAATATVRLPMVATVSRLPARFEILLDHEAPVGIWMPGDTAFRGYHAELSHAVSGIGVDLYPLRVTTTRSAIPPGRYRLELSNQFDDPFQFVTWRIASALYPDATNPSRPPAINSTVVLAAADSTAEQSLSLGVEHVSLGVPLRSRADSNQLAALLQNFAAGDSSIKGVLLMERAARLDPEIRLSDWENDCWVWVTKRWNSTSPSPNGACDAAARRGDPVGRLARGLMFARLARTPEAIGDFDAFLSAPDSAIHRSRVTKQEVSEWVRKLKTPEGMPFTPQLLDELRWEHPRPVSSGRS